MVALTNEHAGSDGDIFSHSFKLMGIGPLVGTRTWGGVIGIWPRHKLVDGTETTQPEFSFWFSDVGWGVENYGTDPTIEVDNAPQDAAARPRPPARDRARDGARPRRAQRRGEAVVRAASATRAPAAAAARLERLDVQQRYELHESIEQPARSRAQSGRRCANASRPGLLVVGAAQHVEQLVDAAASSPCSARSIACCAR